MNGGLVVLIIVCGWSLLSVVASLVVGGMAQARDAAPIAAHRAILDLEAAGETHRAGRRRQELVS